MKIINKLIGAVLGATMALGVGIGIWGGHKEEKIAQAATTDTYKQVTLAEGKDIIIVGNNGSNYTLTSTNGASAAPSIIAVTITNNVLTSTTDLVNHLWTVSGSASGWTFTKKGTSNKLYCTNNNNGVRVGTNTNNVFTISDEGYLLNTATSRYVGIYNSQDWRCYTTINNNIKDQTFTFWEREGEPIPDPDPIPEPNIETRSLADFIAGENTKTKAYLVTGEIKSFKNSEIKDEYGNMVLTDGTNDLVIYGSSIHTSDLSWKTDTGTYAFYNSKKFLTDEYTIALEIGDTITMILIRCDFTKSGVTTIEGQGVILLTCSGWSKVFLQSMTCDATGVTSPNFTNTWTSLKDMFNSLTSNEQSELTSAVADEAGNVIAKAMARYDYLVAKYRYEDFIGRNPAPLASSMRIFSNTPVQTTSFTIIIITTVVIGIVVGSWFVIKRKKKLN